MVKADQSTQVASPAGLLFYSGNKQESTPGIIQPGMISIIGSNAPETAASKSINKPVMVY
jgi:hypothetical protein